MPKMREHLSYSGISTYLQCPLRFFFSRVDKRDPESTSANLTLGKALHSVYARTMGLIYPKIMEPINVEDMQNFFCHEFTGLHSENVDYRNLSFEELLEKGKVYTKLIVEYLTTKKEFSGEELWIEKEFMIPVFSSSGDVLETPLCGVFDAVIIDHNKKQAQIIDFKTVSKRYPEWKLNRNLQMIFYSYALQQILGEEDYRISFRWEVLLKQKVPSIVEYDYLCSEQELVYMVRVIENVQKGLRENIFYPNSGYLCGYCEHFKACQQWH